MPRRRMIDLDVVGGDNFTQMPHSAQVLYFSVLMRADDEGFYDGVIGLMNSVRCSGDDLKMLVAKGFVIPFESGVYVVTDWNRHNSALKKRHATRFRDERDCLIVNEKGSYEVDGGRLLAYRKRKEREEPREIKEEPRTGTRTDNSLRSLSLIKQDKTGLKQSALCGLLVRKGFIGDGELQDPRWDELLDRWVREKGYLDVKIKLAHILAYADKSAFMGDRAYPYLKASLEAEMAKGDCLSGMGLEEAMEGIMNDRE